MKKLLAMGGLLVLVTSSVPAAVFNYTYASGFNNGGVIPDGNVTGWSDTRTVTLGPLRESDTSDIREVSVRLDISGGYNGDLYAYLVHSSGYAVLLNRSGRTSGDGFGYGDSGYSVTFNDQPANANPDIHMYQGVSNPGGGVLTGTWGSDGRAVNPATVVDTDTRSALLTSFTGDANGTWTLFLADMSGGGVSTVTSWGLDISVVPEPTTWAMIIFGVVVAGVKGSQSWRARQAQRKL